MMLQFIRCSMKWCSTPHYFQSIIIQITFIKALKIEKYVNQMTLYFRVTQSVRELLLLFLWIHPIGSRTTEHISFVAVNCAFSQQPLAMPRANLQDTLASPRESPLG